jgi:hypothetical protein
MADKEGSGTDNVVHKTDYKRRVQQVFASVALNNVVTRDGRISGSQQEQKILSYYAGAISAWKESEGMLIINGSETNVLLQYFTSQSELNPKGMVVRVASDNPTETIALLYTTWELNQTYSGRQIKSIATDVRAKIMNSLLPKWRENVDSEGNPRSGKTFDDVLEEVRRTCYIEDELKLRKATAKRKAERDVEALSIADPVEKSARLAAEISDRQLAVPLPAASECPENYEPYGWIPFKLFSEYGYRVNGWPMFTIFSGASGGDGEGAQNSAATAGRTGVRSRRGSSRASVSIEEKEDRLERLRKEDRDYEVESSAAALEAATADRLVECRRIEVEELSLYRQLLHDEATFAPTEAQKLEAHQKLTELSCMMRAKLLSRGSNSASSFGVVRPRPDDSESIAVGDNLSFDDRRVRMRLDPSEVEAAEIGSEEAAGSEAGGSSAGTISSSSGSGPPASRPARQVGLPRRYRS